MRLHHRAVPSAALEVNYGLPALIDDNNVLAVIDDEPAAESRDWAHSVESTMALAAPISLTTLRRDS